MDDIAAAMEDTSRRIADKEEELKVLRQAYAELRAGAEELRDRRAPGGPDTLRRTAAELVYGLVDSDMGSSAYANRVVALELRSLVDRYKLLDVEGLAQQNHDLREELLRLQQENLKLIQSAAEGDTKVRRQTAQVQLALEATAREHFRQLQDSLRRDMYEQIDEKTQLLVHEHGALQAQVRELNKQARLIDTRYRQVSTERQQFKVDSHVADDMNDIMSKQVATLRLQLDQAFLMNRSLETELENAEARAHSTAAEVQRLEERWRRRESARANGSWPQDDEEAQWQLVQQQLSMEKQAQAKLREQRNWWREQCCIYERTNAELQATLQALMDKAGLTLPGGALQPVESVWRKEKSPSNQASSTDSPSKGQARHLETAGSSQTAKVASAADAALAYPTSSAPAGPPPPKPSLGLAGSVSLSRLLHDSTEAVHMQYQPHITGLRAQRTAGSLRYGSPRTSALDVYQVENAPAGSCACPTSAKLALEADKELWHRQKAQRDTSSPQADGHWAQVAHSSLRPASAAAIAGRHALGSPRSSPGRPATAVQRASPTLLFKSRAGALT